MFGPKLAGYGAGENLAKTTNPAHMWRTIIRRNGDVNGGGGLWKNGSTDGENQAVL